MNKRIIRKPKLKPVAEPVTMPQKAALRGRRILIIVENLPVPFDRRVWLEAQTLKSYGAEVTIICPTAKDYDQLEETIDGIRIYRHKLYEASSTLGYIREYVSAVASETWLAWKVFWGPGFDTIHACNPPDLIFLVALPFKLLKRKFVFDHHDLNPELFEAKYNKRGLLWRALVWMERLTFLSANVSIATNESYRKIAIERGRMKPENVYIVRSGPNLKRFKPLPPNPSHRNGRKYLVGYVGVMGEQEGIDILLAAVDYIVHKLRREDIHFCLIGSGPRREDLKKLSVGLGLCSYVTFSGRVSDQEMLEILSTADVCVNPDRVNPMNDLSTMNKIMEYMAVSKPIVQFDVVEGRVSAQGASLYATKNDPIDMAEKLIELIDDPERRKAMGREGYERVVRELSWQSQIPALIAAYQASGAPK